MLVHRLGVVVESIAVAATHRIRIMHVTLTKRVAPIRTTNFVLRFLLVFARRFAEIYGRAEKILLLTDRCGLSTAATSVGSALVVTTTSSEIFEFNYNLFRAKKI